MEQFVNGDVVVTTSEYSVMCVKESVDSKAYYCIYGNLDRDAFIALKNLPDPETYWSSNMDKFASIEYEESEHEFIEVRNES